MGTKTSAVIRSLLLLLCMSPGLASAANYSFYWYFGYGTNAPCTGNWSYDSGTFYCSGSVSLGSGDTLTADWPLGDVNVSASGGFTLRGNVIGTSSRSVSLNSGYSPLTATGTNTVYGSMTSTSGAISLTTTTVNGAVEAGSGGVTLVRTAVTGTLLSSGATSLTDTSIGGTARVNNNLTASGTTFKSNLTVTGTSLLSASTLEANLVNGGDVTATSGTVIAGSVSNSYGTILVEGGRVGGSVTGQTIVGNAAVFGGGLAATSGAVTVTGGSVTGAISSNCCQITLTGTNVTGNVTATSNNIVLSRTTLTGNMSTTNEVRLDDSVVNGNVTAATWGNTTITGTGSSHVYGVCTPTATTPTDLCDGAITPSCLTTSADTFARSVLGNDWVVTSRSGTFGTPRIVNGRLRMTDDTGDASTAATVQRTFPAANNLITVTFKYFGYSSKSSRGADGMALILSDASVTPQPGAFGGSLGYAQKTGIPGFAGGWLGIGLDEFGNYSNPTEGRVGGVGSRSDAVAIRGSGSSEYAYLTGTGSLATGIDNGSATSTPSPGHLYRITVDSRTPGKTLVKVERDTGGTGNNYTTLIAPYDVRTSSGQGAVPKDFMLSFTGSTGGNVNIHELDDLQVCANKMSAVGAQIDHFEIFAPQTGLTCSPMPVTVKACLDAACSLYTEPVTATATLTAANKGVVSSDTQTFTGGTGAFSLVRTTSGTVTLGVGASTPAAKPYTETKCKIGSGSLSVNCAVEFVDSGFVFDIRTQLSNKVSGEVMINAVRKDQTTQRCVPAFQKVDRDLTIWSTYIEPNTGAGRSLEVNGTPVSSNASAPTTMRLKFNDNAQAPINVRYNDAGKLELNVRYTGSAANKDADLIMSGARQFVVKPVGFCVKPAAWSDATTTTCAAGDATCPAFIAAGDGFPVRFRPVGWESDSGDSDLCVGNPTTPNFRHSNLAISSELVQPSGGAAGTLSLSSSNTSLDGRTTYDHLPGASGYSATSAEVVQQVKFSEVGVFRMKVTPPAGGYLDNETVAGGLSAYVGRVTPAYLAAAGSGSLGNVCSNGITYQAQPLRITAKPSLTISGMNRSGMVTTNYDRDMFWSFASSWAPTYFSNTGRVALDARKPGPGQPTSLDCSSEANKANCVAARLEASGSAFGSVSDVVGDGAKTFLAPDDLGLRYLRAASPGPDDRQFDATLSVFTPRAKLVDSDGIFVASATATNTPIDYAFPMSGASVVLGRYRLTGASGPEVSPLNLPLYLERWSGTAFVTDTALADVNCTAVSEATLDNPTGRLTAGKTGVTIGAASQGVRFLTLSAPGTGNAGTLQVTPQVPGWLYFDWLGHGATNPSATASFGGYAGARPLIFRREIYR